MLSFLRAAWWRLVLLVGIGSTVPVRAQTAETYLQVYAPELRNEVAKPLFAFVQAKEPQSNKVVWSSDPTVAVQQKTVDPSQFPASGVEVNYPVQLRNGVVEIPIQFSPKGIPTEGLKSLNLILSGVIRRPDGTLAPFESRVVPVPFSAVSGSAQSLTATAVQNTPQLAAMAEQIQSLKQSEQAARSTSARLAAINESLTQNLSQFREELNRIRTAQLIGSGSPQFEVTGPVNLQPMGYRTVKIVFPSELNPVFLRTEDVSAYTGDPAKAFVIYSTNTATVTVNLGQLAGDTNKTCTIQSEGFIGNSSILMESVARYRSTERGKNATQISVVVDVYRDRQNVDRNWQNLLYPYFTRSLTAYSPAYPAWGGDYNGDSIQINGFDDSQAYAAVKQQFGGENFKIVNVIIATNDDDLSYAAGSKNNFINSTKERIYSIYSNTNNYLSPQKYFQISTLGKSTLEVAPDPVLVDLSTKTGRLKLSDLNFDFFEREYKKIEYELRLKQRQHVTPSGATQYLVAGEGKTNWISPKIDVKFGTLLNFIVDPLIRNLSVTKSRKASFQSYMPAGRALDEYNSFIGGPESLFNTNIEPGTGVLEYRTILKPGIYWIYIDSSLPNSDTDTKYSIELELQVTPGTYHSITSQATRNALASIVDKELQSNGIGTNYFQLWWLPTVTHPDFQVPNKVWASGGKQISFDSTHSGYNSSATPAEKSGANRITSAMIIHELGHTIQQVPDHYTSAGWNNSDAHIKRKLGVHDVMANQNEFGDHILATKLSRGWIDSKLVKVFNPRSATNGLTRFKVKLANLNTTNLGVLADNTFAGLEIRLADGNNLTVEYRGPNQRGYKLFSNYFTDIEEFYDATNNYALYRTAPPDAYFKILETWNNLRGGPNTYTQVRSAQAQPPVLLAESDLDTVPANLYSKNISKTDAQNLDADTAWAKLNGLQLKHDGPFLYPSVPNQELILQNLSSNALLEKLTIKPSDLFSPLNGELIVEYERYTRSDVPNNGPDPSIRPWRGNYQSPDIEVINAWNAGDTNLYNLPHPDIPNEVRVRIHNHHSKAAKKVEVKLLVKDYNVSPGADTTWSNLGSKFIDVPGNSNTWATWTPGEVRGVFAGGTKNSAGEYHKCLKAIILPWGGEEQIEGTTIRFEENSRNLQNNEAQSNYSWTRSESASPADIATVPVQVKNHYAKVLEFEVVALPTNPLFQVFNPAPRFSLAPNEERKIPIGVQYLPEVRDSFKPNYPSVDGHVSIVTVVHDEQYSLGNQEAGHPIEMIGSGASFKVFGGEKLKMVVTTRNKSFEGYFARPDGKRITLTGNLSVVLVKNETTATRTVAPIKSDGSFTLSGSDFTLPMVISFRPTNAPEIGYHFETLPAL